MNVRELVAKLVWLGGLVGYPYLLLKGFGLSLGWSLLGGIALAFVTPALFLLAWGAVDALRGKK